MKAPGKKGFTLVEVIVVLVILAVLASILIPSMVKWIDKAKEKEVYTEIHLVAVAAKSALAEAYGEKASEQEYYLYSSVSGGTTDVTFSKALEEYINDDQIFKNVGSVSADPATDDLYIWYTKAGATYWYQCENGVVTIEKQ